MDNLSNTKVKICGITNLEDAQAAVELGTDALGFIFYKDSKRYVEPQIAGDIISKLPPFITTVGVFVNASVEDISEIQEKTQVSALQLHGDESPEFCSSLQGKIIKVLRVKDKHDLDPLAQYPVEAILLDTYSDKEYGGTGSTFDWGVLKDLKTDKKIILSGGLTPENVSEAISTVRPYAVDVSSGVEASAGKKDHIKLKQFFEAIKNG
ncbi:MAG: phosphoribosylanthranilate isomerase [Thermodesulfobacteriota bacterium]